MAGLKESLYKIARYGVATSFTESELPIDFVSIFQNGIVNQAGGAEKRQGIVKFGSPIPGNFLITQMHSFVVDNTEKIFASAQGRIWLLDEVSKTWTQVYQFPTNNTLRSVAIEKKLIFYNGFDRPFYTTDGVVFSELQPIIVLGDTTTSSNATQLFDTAISGASANASWVLNTHVAINDLVYNVKLGAYGVVTAVVSGSISHTAIGTAATGIGKVLKPPPDNRDQSVADRYRILDLIELNILPTPNDPIILDNIGFLGANSNSTTVNVSGFNFSTSPIRVGDYIYNTTQAAVTQVTAIGVSAVFCVGVSGQTENDTILLLKSAMPVPQRAHVHFGRLYIIDARDPTKMAFSGAADPQDFTVDSGTINIGDLQPSGETFKALVSFQKYLVIFGSENSYFYQGSNPSDPKTFDLLGTLPQGCLSSNGVAAIGNQVMFTSPNGIDAVSLIQYSSQLGRTPLSTQINTTLRDALRFNPESEITMVHYPRRSMVLIKVGSEMFVFNYTPSLEDSKQSGFALNAYLQSRGSWSVFDGLFAQCNSFLVRENGDLMCAGVGGQVYLWDQGTYSDDGNVIPFTYQTGWLTTSDPKSNVRQKVGKYIKPLFQAGSQVVGRIDVIAPFEGYTTDSTEFIAGEGIAPIGLFIIGIDKIGGSNTTNAKLPLRWKGEVCRLTFTTSDTAGPLVLARFVLYSTEIGRL